MNLYQWLQTREAREFGSMGRGVYLAAQATVEWQGERVPMFFEPLEIYGTWLVTFRPQDAPAERALVVAQPAEKEFLSDVTADQFVSLEPLELEAFDTDETTPAWLPRCVELVEKQSYGRLEVENSDEESDEESDEDLRCSACWCQLYGADGWRTRHSYKNYVTIGSYLHRTSAVLSDPQYDEELYQDPWCEAERAPAWLHTLDDAEFRALVARISGKRDSLLGAARLWNTFSFEQRRHLLPPLEREIEAEVCRVMQWALWSEPSLRTIADAQDNEHIRDCLWRRPRFCARPEPLFGHFFYNASWWTWSSPNYSQFLLDLDKDDDEAEDEEDATKTDYPLDAESRLRAIWSHVERAFAPQIAQLRESGELHPSIAHWCHFRGAYIVQVETPTAHEKLESRVALRDWLRARAGVELRDIERALEAH